MHIAVCMDDALGRKQLERLLSRSADRRIAADPDVPYYVQSYGNKEALFLRPFMYDLFFIDLIHSDINSIELIKRLRKTGVVSTIVYCPGREDLSSQLEAEDDVLILRQPVAVADLEEVLDRALEDMMNRKPKIDIRANDRTVTVLEEEFLYAEQLKDVMAVHLINNVTVMSSEILKNFAARMTGFPDLCSISDDVLVHRQAVAEISFGKVVLKDGRKFKANPKRIKDLKK